jgi:hypothetical protein
MVRRIQRRIQMSPSSSATTAPSLLATFALPKLLERTGAGDHLRIWVPACALQIDTVPAYVARLKEDCRTGVRLNLSAVFAQTYFGSERNPAVHVICDGTA